MSTTSMYEICPKCRRIKGDNLACKCPVETLSPLQMAFDQLINERSISRELRETLRGLRPKASKAPLDTASERQQP